MLAGMSFMEWSVLLCLTTLGFSLGLVVGAGLLMGVAILFPSRQVNHFLLSVSRPFITVVGVTAAAVTFTYLYGEVERPGPEEAQSAATIVQVATSAN